MKKMKKFVLFGVLAISYYQLAFSQVDPMAIGYYQDALIFAQPTVPMGTARSQALGGAGSTMGADLSSCIINPAGLGIATRGQVNLGLNLNQLSTSSNYINKDTKDSYLFPKISYVGWIAPLLMNEGNIAKNASLGVSIIRTNNYQKRFAYEGINTRSTMADRFTLLAEGIDARVFENEAFFDQIYSLASLAYATYVINPYLNDSTSYYTEFRDINDNLVAPIRQKETYTVKGGETMVHVAVGVNLMDKLYLGAGLGLTNIRYRLNSIYEETLTRQAVTNELQAFSLTNQRVVTGGGLQLSLGGIYRPFEMLRIGVSIYSPTFYVLNETDDNEMTATFAGNSFTPVTRRMVQSKLEYSYTSPLKVNAGFLLQFQKRGFVTAEAEWVTYGAMKLSTDAQGVSLDADSRTIANLYRTALNLKAGVEARWDIWRARLGTAYYQDPYRVKLDNINRNTLCFTGGVGVIAQNFAVDLTAIFTRFKTAYTPYALPDPNFYFSVETKNRILSFILGGTLFF